MGFLHQVERLVGGVTTRRLVVAALGAALLSVWLQLGLGTVAQSALPSSGLRPLTAIAPDAEQVETGIYAMNLYNLDAASNTYYLDFYTWFKWKGDLDPTLNLEFANGVEDWGLSVVPTYEEPEVLPDGSFYQTLRVEGRFVHPFALARYPLDQQSLSIVLENSVYTADQLLYMADQAQSGYSESLSIPGWRIQSFDVSNLVRTYATNFGDPRLGAATQYSALKYSLHVSRPISFFVWKLLLPLIIVVAASWGSLLLNPEQIDSRIILPVTALLTIVFLQQSYSAGLPDVGYLVLLDKIYAIAYILIVVSILEAIITADWIKNEKVDHFDRVIRLDRTLLVIQSVVLTIGIIAVIRLS